MKKNEIIIYESDDHSTALEVRIEDETVWLTQYPEILVKEFTKSHDRFLIIDSKIVYHIGASLKDLGKKWFAFSKLGLDVNEIMNRVELEF